MRTHKEEADSTSDTSPAQPTDLRSITRMSDVFRTRVTVHMVEYGVSNLQWLILGLTQLTPRRGANEGRWTLEAKMTEGVTDFEHDSACAMRLPLIGVTFEHVISGLVRFNAWIDPNDFDDFRVPRAGYDPTKHPKAIICEDKHCEKSHVIVPEGFFVPPMDRDLYKAVRGKRVEIIMGPTFK